MSEWLSVIKLDKLMTNGELKGKVTVDGMGGLSTRVSWGKDSNGV